jgi:hypothetical protein
MLHRISSAFNLRLNLLILRCCLGDSLNAELKAPAAYHGFQCHAGCLVNGGEGIILLSIVIVIRLLLSLFFGYINENGMHRGRWNMSQPNGVAVSAKDNGDTGQTHQGDSPSTSQRSGTARPLVNRLPKSTPPAARTQQPSPPLERASPNEGGWGIASPVPFVIRLLSTPISDSESSCSTSEPELAAANTHHGDKNNKETVDEGEAQGASARAGPTGEPPVCARVGAERRRSPRFLSSPAPSQSLTPVQDSTEQQGQQQTNKKTLPKKSSRTRTNKKTAAPISGAITRRASAASAAARNKTAEPDSTPCTTALSEPPLDTTGGQRTLRLLQGGTLLHSLSYDAQKPAETQPSDSDSDYSPSCPDAAQPQCALATNDKTAETRREVIQVDSPTPEPDHANEPPSCADPSDQLSAPPFASAFRAKATNAGIDPRRDRH